MGFYKNTNGVLTPIAGGVSNSNAPIGAIFPFGGTSAPSGYLMCDGSAVSRSDYSALFAVIGTSFGSGDGSTTFNVPDLRGKFLEGTPSSGTIGTSIAAGLPNITGTLQPIATDRGVTGFEAKSGAFTNSTNTSQSGAVTADSSYRATINFDASKSNSIYGNSTTVQPPAVCVNYIIKAKDVNLSVGGQALADRIEALETNNTRTVAACTSVRIKNTTVYARKRNGVVTINGAPQLSENLTRNSWVEILTIPTGYRPANYEYGTIIIDTGEVGGVACPVDIDISGKMRVFTYNLSISQDIDLTNKYIFISATYTTTD